MLSLAGRMYRVAVNARADALLSEVLALPDADRAELVAEALASFDERPVEDDSDELDRLWSHETDRRARQVTCGAVETESWDSILSRVAESRHTR